MALILWGPWQVRHITKRRGVSATDFDVAWHDPERIVMEQEHHHHGTYWVSVGCAGPGRALKMVWRWHEPDTVWPITAYSPAARRGRRGR